MVALRALGVWVREALSGGKMDLRVPCDASAGSQRPESGHSTGDEITCVCWI